MDNAFVSYILQSLHLQFLGTAVGFTAAVYSGLSALNKYAPDVTAGFFSKAKLYNRYIFLLDLLLQQLRKIYFVPQENATIQRPLFQIYGFFLSFSLGYTAVLFFVSWAAGGTGSLGQIPIITAPYTSIQRLAVVMGFAFLGYFVWTAVHYEALPASVVGFARRNRTFRFVLAVLCGYAVFYVQHYGGNSRTFSFHPLTILVYQASLGVTAFIAILWTERPLVGFFYAITACYGYFLGVPILIGVPLTVAIATTVAGYAPVFISTLITPTLMLLYYYLAPHNFRHTEQANLVLAAIACLPVLIAVLTASTRRESSSGYSITGKDILYAAIAFLPLWLPVSFSERQISDPIAYAIVVFWFLFPVINAIWDGLSWYVTYRLLEHLHGVLQGLHGRKKEHVVDSVIQRIYDLVMFLCLCIGHVVVNVIISFSMFATIFFLYITFLTILNGIIVAIEPRYVVDVNVLLRSIERSPLSGEGSWVVAFVFATLAPALIHLVFILLSLLTFGIGTPYIQGLLDTLSDDDLSNREAQRIWRILSFYVLSCIFISSSFVVTLLAAWNTQNAKLGIILSELGGVGHMLGAKLGGM